MSKKILIIDDEPDVRDYLVAIFEKEGYQTRTATDGVEGMKILKSDQFDLITLDLQMPNDTGTDFYRKIHRDNKYKDIPIIVVSGLAGRHLAIRKPIAVFDKPIDKDKLVEKVREIIG